MTCIDVKDVNVNTSCHPSPFEKRWSVAQSVSSLKVRLKKKMSKSYLNIVTGLFGTVQRKREGHPSAISILSLGKNDASNSERRWSAAFYCSLFSVHFWSLMWHTRKEQHVFNAPTGCLQCSLFSNVLVIFLSSLLVHAAASGHYAWSRDFSGPESTIPRIKI